MPVRPSPLVGIDLLVFAGDELPGYSAQSDLSARMMADLESLLRNTDYLRIERDKHSDRNRIAGPGVDLMDLTVEVKDQAGVENALFQVGDLYFYQIDAELLGNIHQEIVRHWSVGLDILYLKRNGSCLVPVYDDREPPVAFCLTQNQGKVSDIRLA